jgi:hypothetical protein
MSFPKNLKMQGGCLLAPVIAFMIIAMDDHYVRLLGEA